MTYSNITLIKVWNIVKSIDLVNIFKAALLDHWFRTTRPFFGWLEKESYHFIGWDLTSIFDECLCSS